MAKKKLLIKFQIKIKIILLFFIISFIIGIFIIFLSEKNNIDYCFL